MNALRCRNNSPISANDPPARSTSVATVCRRRVRTDRREPARRHAVRTSSPIAPAPPVSGPNGAARLQEHVRSPRRRAAVAEIVDQRLANINRERQPLVPILFAANNQLAGTPVDVCEFELGDLARTQAEAREHVRIAKSRRPTAVVRSQLANRRATSSAGSAFGNDAHRHAATLARHPSSRPASTPRGTRTAASLAAR